MNFEFATANRILFGNGRINEAAPIAATFGRRALLVHGRRRIFADALAQQLARQGVDCIPFSIVTEPGIIAIQDRCFSAPFAPLR